MTRAGEEAIRPSPQEQVGPRISERAVAPATPHLRASPTGRGVTADNEARLDGEDGLLLTPSIDHLFDRGFISFDDKGRLLRSPIAHKESLRRVGIATDAELNVGGFSDGRRRHLDYHREMVFLRSAH